MSALDLIVRQGKSLYIGLSNYDAKTTAAALKILKDLGHPAGFISLVIPCITAGLRMVCLFVGT